jgi:hypothetical protein
MEAVRCSAAVIGPRSFLTRLARWIIVVDSAIEDLRPPLPAALVMRWERSGLDEADQKPRHGSLLPHGTQLSRLERESMHFTVRKFLLVATAVVATVLPVTAGAANAGEAQNAKTQYLTSNPKPGMPASIVQRRIYLAAGRYAWRDMRTSNVCGYGLNIGAGWYTWRDELYPRNGDYMRFGYLDPDTPGWATASLTCRWQFSVSQNLTWGSYLLSY